MEERGNPLINAARGRDACGINHDELHSNLIEQIKDLEQLNNRLKEEQHCLSELLEATIEERTQYKDKLEDVEDAVVDLKKENEKLRLENEALWDSNRKYSQEFSKSKK